MAALSQIVANLEQQCALYTDLESVLAEQQSALIGRATDRLEAANRRHALLAEALATAETQRRVLNGAGGKPITARAARPGQRRPLKERLSAGCPPAARLQRVTHLARPTACWRRTRRRAAAPAAPAGHEDATGYAPPTQARPAPAHSLSPDVTA